MSKVNSPPAKKPVLKLAGGSGNRAAAQPAEQLLRRAVLACLLWEDVAYEGSGSDSIAALIPQVDAVIVAEIAMEARINQKLRHVPLFIASEMLKHDAHRKLVALLLPQIITRPDQITDFLAIYWKNGKKPIANQAKRGLADCFNAFSEFQFAKYDRDGKIKLRHVMFLVRPKPVQGNEELFKKIASRELSTPDTWEVALSTGKDKKETWTRLIEEGKLGALAFLRNLRNMKDANVQQTVIRKGFNTIKSQMLLPLNFLSAAAHAPEFLSDISDMMIRTYNDLPKLKGKTIFVVDVSGSMGNSISSKSNFKRQEVANAMAILAFATCEEVEIWCTAGDDSGRRHKTELLKYPSKGFELNNQILKMSLTLGAGGIFTRQCLEHIKKYTSFAEPDRIIIFSDSQDCDHAGSGLPAPFGKNNYIVDVSANARGINYKGVWTAEISGWSEKFLPYIASSEGVQNTFEEE